jgi:signal transduction histidine kinase
MLLNHLNRRVATLVRLGGLLLITVSVTSSHPAPGTSGRHLLISVLLAICVIAWLGWTWRPMPGNRITVEIWALAAAGGLLIGAAPNSGASAFVFVAVLAAAVRTELLTAIPVLAVGVLTLAASHLIYNDSAVGVLAYGLGLTAAMLAGSNGRQTVVRAEQAELLLAQNQRSEEERLRAARLEESTRIAREIHDVLAHALAGLTIQLEATTSLIENDADRETILARVQRAHELAREGLRETRRAVGALRSDPVSAPAEIEALVAEYRAEAPAELILDGDAGRLTGEIGQAMLRVVQEALTNVRKHAPGADVAIELHAGASADAELVLVVYDRPVGPVTQVSGLAESGGGYGVRGMRERAVALGGTLEAGATDDGWRIEMRIPSPTPHPT